MNKKGFTLIELLIVVAIIGIIAAIAIPNLLVALQKGKQKATMGDMKSIGTAVMSYAVDYSFVPQEAEGPISALGAGQYFEPFYIKVLPTSDAWGGMVQYQRGVINTPDQDLYSIHSWGRDGANTPPPAIPLYDTTTLSDFNNDIYFSDIFTVGPRVKK